MGKFNLGKAGTQLKKISTNPAFFCLLTAKTITFCKKITIKPAAPVLAGKNY